MSSTCREFRQSEWDEHLASHVAGRAVEWFAEDLGHECDWTSVGLIDRSARSELAVVTRRPGVIAGLAAAGIVARVADTGLEWRPLVADAAVVAGTRCRVYDTRKTVPGWRLLDKYAVRMGGGWNHRMGLYDAILIKDNHLAALATAGISPAAAVKRARSFVAETFPPSRAEAMVVEIEIDAVETLDSVLEAGPDIVLLDNMTPAQLASCVARRDAVRPGVVLEASGGIRLDTVAEIARTGVDRVSTGWPTHDAPWLDVALDWDGC
jgi:nicotinate-nucleotide pyrophosphorylase (carboxylating)